MPRGQVSINGLMAGTLSGDVFLELLDDVLRQIGRQALPTTGVERRVVTVNSSDRVLQILAGPGAGKTELLVWRVLYELFVNETPSSRILVTTFTKRASTELEIRTVERVEALIRVARRRNLELADVRPHDLRIGTIHSLCDELLSEFDTSYLESGSQLVDEVETAVRIAREHRRKLGYNGGRGAKRVLDRLFENPAVVSLFRPPWFENGHWPATVADRVDAIEQLLAQHIETWMPRCMGSGRPNGIDSVHGGSVTPDLVKLYGRWDEYLREQNILDFATIQQRFVERQTAVADHVSHVFVDEFQDSNPIQFELHTGWLATKDIRLTVVGDDDQAIYRFRGSDIECFNQLGPFCLEKRIPFRLERLELNHRSTQTIVSFAHAFKGESALGAQSMAKTISAPEGTICGPSVRLLEGNWADLCTSVSAELSAFASGRHDNIRPPSVAVLMFSTSERRSKFGDAPAVELRDALGARGIRMFNPRNKTAGHYDTPVGQLFGLISYLIDPISYAPAGKRGRTVMVCASDKEESRRQYAAVVPPAYPISLEHQAFQKHFFKANGGDIGKPSADRRDVVRLVDDIRSGLVRAATGSRRPRLTLSGFVARLLTTPFFRDSGYTEALFRQALFTKILESNIAPTRRTKKSLDQPLAVTLDNRKPEWDYSLWSFLSIFGTFLESLDDLEVEAFEDGAVPVLTFHQAKGLEFDHVYVAATGRPVDAAPALRTLLFSGEPAKYSVNADGSLQVRSTKACRLAAADRDRETYVALTRAKTSITVLSAVGHRRPYMMTSPAILSLFNESTRHPHRQVPRVDVAEWPHA